jgi:hypothetical protein
MSNEPLSKETILPSLIIDNKSWNEGVFGQPLSINYSFINGLPPYYFNLPARRYRLESQPYQANYALQG